MEGTTQHPMTDRARELQARIAPQLDDARQSLADFNVRAKTFIRENPGTCLLGGLALGFLIGKIASRRW